MERKTIINYQKIVDDFITEYPDYKSDVLNFTEYLETHWGNSLSGELLRILLKGTDVANPELYDAISFNRLRENSYMKRMMAYIEKWDLLAGIVEQEPLTFMQAEELLAWSNEQLDVKDCGETTDL